MVITKPTGTEALPEADEVARGGLTQVTVLTATAVSEVTTSADGLGANYYDNSDGRFYSMATDGTPTRLSNKQFPDVESVAWNQDNEKAVIEFPDGSNIIYDFVSEVQVTLPKHWEDFSFSPTTDEIISKSIGLDPDNRGLIVSNDDGSQTQVVQALGDNADKVQINPSPTDQIIAFSDTASSQTSLSSKMIIPIGKNHENFDGLTVEGMGFESTWSPRGSTLLYSVAGEYSNYRPLLWAVSGNLSTFGDERRTLGLNTWVNKCTFADDTTAYCAVPQQMEDNWGLQPVLAARVPDDLYLINLASGKSSLIARPAENVSMSNLSLSDDNTSLFFTDSLTGRLELIKLQKPLLCTYSIVGSPYW
ncbi:MAG: hypothetical protein V1716_04965 [Candidatus Uhrbacteria bacterium]